MAEEAREAGWELPSFGRQLFLGEFRLDLIHPHPRPDEESRRRGEEFCARLREFCEASVDGALIEREDRIPDEVIKGLAALGAFGMKIAPEYGGLGLSYLYYIRALVIVGSVSPALSALLSAHQSIGVPQPVTMFGHRGAEAAVPAAVRAGRDQRVPAHRARCRLRPGQADHDRDPVG